MGRHLVIESNNVTDTTKEFISVGHLEYMKKRAQFWKWKLHRTMGRPVLKLRRSK